MNSLYLLLLLNGDGAANVIDTCEYFPPLLGLANCYPELRSVQGFVPELLGKASFYPELKGAP